MTSTRVSYLRTYICASSLAHEGVRGKKRVSLSTLGLFAKQIARAALSGVSRTRASNLLYTRRVALSRVYEFYDSRTRVPKVGALSLQCRFSDVNRALGLEVRRISVGSLFGSSELSCVASVVWVMMY